MKPYEEVTNFLDSAPKTLSETAFKSQLFKAFNLTTHPGAEEAYRIAYKWGSSGGFYQVLEVFEDITSLLKEPEND